MQKKFNTWFLLAVLSTVMAVLDLIEQRNGYVVGFRLLAVVLFVGLGLLQSHCRSPRGQKLFCGVAVVAVALLVVTLVLGLLAR